MSQKGASQPKPVVEQFSIRKLVTIPIVIIFAAAIIYGLVDPSGFFAIENMLADGVYFNFGWLIVAVTMVTLGLLIWLYFTKAGDVIIGGPNVKPLYKTKWEWFMVSLCATIGTGMVIWGVCETANFFWEPVPGLGVYEPGSQEAAVQGIGTILLHWGIPSISLYTIMGVVIGFAVYNMRLPFRVSSIAYPLIGKKCVGKFGDFLDILSIFAIAVSVAAVLGVGTVTLAAGVSSLTGLESDIMLQGTILVVLVATFIISSWSGLLKGVKWLSSINTKIFIFVAVFVFIFGGTAFILSLSVEALGASASMFFDRMTYMGTVNGDLWPKWWTVSYWTWMIVYGPMMGMFFAKIGRGRTFREYMQVQTLVGIFIIAWFCIFGGATVNMEIQTEGAVMATIRELGNEAAVFAFFNELPLSSIMGALFVLVLFLSVVTMADGLASTVASMTIFSKKGAIAEPPGYLKIFWGLVMASLAFVAIFSNTVSEDGIDMLMALKLLPMIGTFPMLIIYVIAFPAVVKMFNNREKYDVAYFPETAIVEKELIQDYTTLSDADAAQGAKKSDA